MRKSYNYILKKQLMRGRILWPFSQLLKYIGIYLGHKIQTPISGPIHAVIFATYACNLNCVFCNYPEKHILKKRAGLRELSTQEMKNVISDLHHLNTTVAAFTGGEPVLRKDIHELIEFTAGKGMLTHLSSNGYAFRNKEETRKLFESGLDATSISIDSPYEEIHDAIRGKKGNFKQVMTAIENVRTYKERTKKRISLTTTTVINEENVDSIPALIELLKDAGIEQIGFIPDHDFGDNYTDENREKYFAKRNNRLLETIDFLIDYARKEPVIENTVEYLRLFKNYYNGKPLPIPCYAGYATIAVDSWGEIYPCFTYSMLERSFANIRAVSLMDFWKSERAQNMRDKCSECRECYWNNQTEINLMFSKFNYKRV